MANWLISGAAKGLGLHLSKALLAQGHKVVGLIRNTEDCAMFQALAPGASFAVQFNVADTSGTAAAVQAAVDLAGPIDVLVNNAGYGYTGAIEEIPLAEMRALFDVNLFGAIALIQAVLPAMRSRRAGLIINVSSVSGLAPWAGSAIYGASKFAMECIGRTLRDEVKPLGIRVVNVAPGGMRTHFGGGSLKGAEPTIADYAITAHLARPTLANHQGEEPSDPAKVAKEIIAVSEQAEPPALLLLGPDAYKYATYHFAELAEQIDTWKSVTLSTEA
ncbi:oxidoreductase [Halioxenophilus aromaticivorans]|uniref:Oxidoreductase n=1 Tax=Halioxenophilus aromaticivorans TaxID=1306992 RepID=A0AAV3U8R6_9ALTE